ncbi:MAG: hypothetical protein AB9919_12685 [Geobacteraceae bacterium]
MEFFGRLRFNRRRGAAVQYIIDRTKAGLFTLEIIFVGDSGAFRMQLLGRFGKGNRLRYFPYMVSPLLARAFCVKMTGTGLLPYIRPLFESILFSRALMKYARIVLIGWPVFPTAGNYRFSIRWSDLFCHRST